LVKSAANPYPAFKASHDFDAFCGEKKKGDGDNTKNQSKVSGYRDENVEVKEADAFDDFFKEKEKRVKVNTKAQIKEAIKSGDVSALEKLLPTLGTGTIQASKTMKLGRSMVDKIKNAKLI
jgi:hypothetical protein